MWGAGAPGFFKQSMKICSFSKAFEILRKCQFFEYFAKIWRKILGVVQGLQVQFGNYIFVGTEEGEVIALFSKLAAQTRKLPR